MKVNNFKALEEVLNRKPVNVEREENLTSDYYAMYVFDRPKMKKYLPVLARQNPKEKFNSHKDGISFTDPATPKLLAKRLKKIAKASKGYNDRVTVWLSEGRRYCHNDMQKSMKEIR